VNVISALADCITHH